MCLNTNTLFGMNRCYKQIEIQVLIGGALLFACQKGLRMWYLVETRGVHWTEIPWDPKKKCMRFFYCHASMSCDQI